MSVTFENPAPIAEAVDLFFVDMPMKPIGLKTAILQLHKSESYGVRNDAGELVAAGGFYPEGPGRFEIWMVCSEELKPHILPAVRFTRLTLGKLAQSGPVTVTARVQTEHEPGQRLAKLCGFEFAYRHNGFEIWTWKPEA